MTTLYHLLVVITDPALLDPCTALALRLLPQDGLIYLVGLITVEPEKSLSESALLARSWRDRLYEVARCHPTIHDEVQVLVDYQPFNHVLEQIAALEMDLLLVQSASPDSTVGGMTIDAIFSQTPCDTVVLNGTGWHHPGDVLLSLRGGPNMSLGVRVAQCLADQGTITLFHAADHRRKAPDLELVMRAVPQISRTVTAITEITKGILEEAVDHKAIVMGASFRRPEKNTDSGHSVISDVFHRSGLPVILVRGAIQESFDFHLPYPLTVEAPLSNRVDRWFAQNTFHSSEFDDLQELLQLKAKRGVTISIALPSLNEAETVGHVIQTLKTALMDQTQLVDEIVLIDSNSTDQTVPIAQSLGIPTYIHQQILTEQVGSYHGKGEALWKSLYVTKGDIIVWVDTDITNIHPRFIYGLLGPLLKHPRIDYVKGFYARPIQVDGKLQAFGGGRVTELVARPLLNLFYPELSGIVQPLSGEYAGRRTVLEQLPFFSGYGVETGLLLDLHERYGLDSIAQVDLEVRVHHNQALVNLSKMSFAILQVFIARIENRYGIQLLDKANQTMKLVIQEPERFALDIAQIADIERPPMASIPAYQQRNEHER
ncbi:MAG: glucosyl-3-phosphoglycerate synthase [Anaerolineae bacterium]|jgi:glucosyl-3-phosphoglycerate synthase|nr:glucosyl-3-phosphoglycerate synthase [Anaerolineae bacterium]